MLTTSPDPNLPWNRPEPEPAAEPPAAEEDTAGNYIKALQQALAEERARCATAEQEARRVAAALDAAQRFAAQANEHHLQFVFDAELRASKLEARIGELERANAVMRSVGDRMVGKLDIGYWRHCWAAARAGIEPLDGHGRLAKLPAWVPRLAAAHAPRRRASGRRS